MVRKKLLGEEIAGRLARQIATRGLLPGTELPSESELSRIMGVGRRPVRDGLRQLTSQGIVETRQGKRAVVSEWRSKVFSMYFDVSKLQLGGAARELYELRFALEVRAAELAAARRSPSDIAEINAAAEAVAASSESLNEYVDADVRFHSAVIAASKNRFFVSILQALASTLRAERVRGATNRIAQRRSSAQTLAAITAVAAAIESSDGDAAASAMNAHLQDGLTYYWTDDEGDAAPEGTSTGLAAGSPM